tara:strand:- start:21200 stop:22075 length:876 start_codon:yes stop_codon:yes gene_type:complete
MPKAKNKKNNQADKKAYVDKPKKPTISRGQRQYMLAKDVKASQEDYAAQVADEEKKAGKRSLWTSVGGILGAGVAVMAAPAVLGAVGLGTAGGLVTGLGTGLLTGIGSAGGSMAGLKTAKTAGKAERGAVKSDKFFEKKAQEATETFKDYDKKIAKSAKWQAIGSGVFAGLQAGGAFKKAGEWTKKGLNIGQTPDAALGGVDAGISVNVTPAGAENVVSESVGKTVYADMDALQGAYKASTANRDLLSAAGDYLYKGAGQAAIGYGVNKVTGGNQNQNLYEEQEIQLPTYS